LYLKAHSGEGLKNIYMMILRIRNQYFLQCLS